MNPLTQQHRAQQLLLRRDTVAQVERIWPALDWARLDASFPAFAAAMAQVVQRNRQTSTGLAAGYLRTLRRAEGVTGTVKPALAPPLVVDQFHTALLVTSVVAAKGSASRGVDGAVAMGNALTQTKGSMARLVLDAGRTTITDTLQADPASRGWRRVLGGGGDCDFCAPRAGVRMTSDVVFEAHDHCGCTAEPIYG